jgi:sialic acid synthase
MKPVYIIAECGQNHNGEFGLAQELIDMCVLPMYYAGQEFLGVQAIKFCKRDMQEEMTQEMADRPYDSPHAFGSTYGEHRAKLELSYEEHAALYNHAKYHGLDFIDTVCSPLAVEKLLKVCSPDKLKIASRDVTNIPLLKAVGETGIPVIISNGMADNVTLQRALEYLPQNKTVLYCVSEYPAGYESVKIANFLDLMSTIDGGDDNIIIGFSDHTSGVLAGAILASYGAEVIEKHITLDEDVQKRLKGTDQAGSIDRAGLYRYVRDIRNVGKMLSTDEPKNENKIKTRTKLMRSACSSGWIHYGDVLTENHLCMLSPGDGMTWDEAFSVIGKKSKGEIPPMTKLEKEWFA